MSDVQGWIEDSHFNKKTRHRFYCSSPSSGDRFNKKKWHQNWITSSAHDLVSRSINSHAWGGLLTASFTGRNGTKPRQCFLPTIPFPDRLTILLKDFIYSLWPYKRPEKDEHKGTKKKGGTNKQKSKTQKKQRGNQRNKQT